MHRIHGTFLLILYFTLSSVLSASDLLKIGSDYRQSDLTDFVQKYEDKSLSLTLANILRQGESLPFEEMQKRNLGYTKSAYWLKFRAQNEDANAKLFFLEISYPLLDEIELFQRNLESGNVQSFRAGDSIPFYQRAILHQNFVFPISLRPETKYEFFLRVKTESTMQIPTTLWSEIGFVEHTIAEQKTFGLYYGIMLAMLAYNLFLFFGTRDRSYVYYVLFLVGYVMFQACLNGLAFQYLWPELTWWGNASLPFFMFFGGSWGSQFSREFLRLRADSKSLDRVLFYYFIFGQVMAVISLFLSFAVGIKVAIAYVALMVVLLITSGLVSIWKGYRAARFYLTAWIFLLIGIVTYIMKTLTVLPSNFVTEYAIQFGSSFEVILLSLALADRINILKEEKERAQKSLIQNQKEALEKQTSMSKSFERFVPKQFLNFLGKEDIIEIKLGDQARREMTIVFSDIRHFTRLSEKMDPKENFDFLNSYLKRMTPIVIRNGGFIDKYIGDAVMALFPESGEDALMAAIEMQSEIRLYNHHRLKVGYEPIRIGVGMHSGLLMLGTIGTEERMEGTVISDTVNLASRIEGITKKFDASILISEKTLHLIPDPTKYAMRLIGRVRVKGKEEDVVIYDVYEGLSDFIMDLRHSTKYEFEKGVTNFLIKNLPEAENCFEKVISMDPTDYAAEAYLKAIRKVSSLRK
ncbi:adenylate/guanylate cyclase [Leptospira perolatii]|uniref:Adenylate/guanylate cyclase n=1 Tax=Leptospira perolatii TaxID=2023191 RepID=A0A2M9ZJC5_9LEPT|nr:7TM diverse intracellular signaling domain-containing protein [Leptospira perolatii]PJZ68836.1 adenylate/guanylate cyclase [Leptospira perolatii]PJZ72167.1 adenylate/guanylate cyclase [Leptospira perolatii]